MFSLVLATAIASVPYTEQQTHIDKMCAAVVGIPYASDNFSDEEWARFQLCRDVMQQAHERRFYQ